MKTLEQKREANRIAVKKYSEKNKDKIAARHKKYYLANKDKLLEYNMSYIANRKKSDSVFKLSFRIRNLVYKACIRRGWSKNSKTFNVIGCTANELQAYLINTAKRNYGGKYFPGRLYHIDHVIPISQAKTESDLLKLNHYTNLQYLLPADNRKKSNKIGWVKE